MKTLFTIFLSASYLMLTAGVGVNQHYCGDKFVGFKISSKSSACCCVEMGEQSGCCKTESYYFKLDIDQKAPTNTDFRFFNAESDIIKVDPIQEESSSEHEVASPVTKPPPKKAQPIYLLFSQFMFYG